MLRTIAIVGGICSAFLLAFGTGSAGAQTRFLLPDTIANVTHYRFGEECYAAVLRTQDRFEHRQLIWRDTTVMATREMTLSLADETIAIAQQCAAKFSVDAVPLERYGLWVSVYLAANRDDLAMAILRRRLAQDDAKDSTKRSAMLWRVIQSYVSARPVRVAIVDSLYQQWYALNGKENPMTRIWLLGTPFTVLEDLRDTTVMMAWAQRRVALFDSMSSTDRAAVSNHPAGRFTVNEAVDFLSRAELRDSLRKSTKAFVALKRANWLKATQGNPFEGIRPIGEIAKPIEAEFWFPQKEGMTSKVTGPGVTPVSHEAQGWNIARPVRPAPGKAGLIFFLYGECSDETGKVPRTRTQQAKPEDCWDAMAVLKRLSQRFPTLDITIVSQTAGFVGSSPVQNPEEEANMLANWWLGFHRLPGTLGVRTTSFFRLDPPDNRRIDENDANYDNYGWRGAIQVRMALKAFVIDSDGVIVHADQLNRSNEGEFQEILDIIMARNRVGK